MKSHRWFLVLLKLSTESSSPGTRGKAKRNLGARFSDIHQCHVAKFTHPKCTFLPCNSSFTCSILSLLLCPIPAPPSSLRWTGWAPIHSLLHFLEMLQQHLNGICSVPDSLINQTKKIKLPDVLDHPYLYSRWGFIPCGLLQSKLEIQIPEWFGREEILKLNRCPCPWQE